MINGFSNYTREELINSLSSIGENVYISNDVIFHNPQNISIGNNVRIDSQCILITSKDTKIKIGNDVHISCGCYYYGNSGNITLEDSVCTSARCTLYTGNADYTDGYMANSVAPVEYKKSKVGNITLKKHSVVGCYTVILPGIVLEHATAVGSHSLVTKSTTPFDIIAGTPAKFVKKRKNVYLN